MSTATASLRTSFPFSLKFEPRQQAPLWVALLMPLLSIVLALLIGALVLVGFGANPLEAYRRIFEAGFGSIYGLSETVVKAIPLAIAGLAVSVAFRMRLWNIGAEGQLTMGAIVAGGIALFWLPAGLSRPLTLAIMLIGAAIGGGLWGGIAGFLKARFGVNEIISTLMLNYIAQEFMNYLVFGPWSARGAHFPLTVDFPDNAWLPRLLEISDQFPIFQGLRIHLGLLFAVVLAALLAYVLSRTRWGFEIRVIGENAAAARYAGMNLTRNIVLVMVVSGAMAGIAGMAETAGVIHKLQQTISPGYGFTAIIVAWLAKLNPGLIILVAFLFGGLLTGGGAIQTSMHLPAAIAQVLQGAILFSLIGGEIFVRNRVRLVRR